MKGIKVFRALGVLVFYLMFSWAEIYGGEKWALTIPYRARSKEERIDALKIVVRNAWVHSITKFPRGWSMIIDDLGYAIEIKGYATHGVGMKYPDFFRDFVVFEVKDLPPDRKFSMDLLVEMEVDEGPASDTPRKVLLKKEELSLRRITNVEVR